MNAVRKDVLEALRSLEIPYEMTEHPPVYTIEEMEALGLTRQGQVAKNLFLRDAKGKRHFLVVLFKDKRADLKQLQEQLHSTKLSFASEERLEKYLGLQKGAVSPLGMFNDTPAQVEVAFDRDLSQCTAIGVHPNENTATLWISFEGLQKVASATGHTIQLIDL